MKYFLVAGERSGDMHASKLVRALKWMDAEARFEGFGGSYMEEEGVRILKHYSSFSFMGLLEVLLNLGKIRRTLREAKRAIRDANPDVLILVDFPGINLKLATYARKLNIRTCYYISPKIWAWKESRIKRIKRDIDKMLVIFPFEVDYYRGKNYEVHYVGNPLIDAIRDYDFDQGFELDGSKTNIAVLPGSRKQEIKASANVVREIAKGAPDYQFAIAAVDNIDRSLYNPYDEIPNAKLFFNKTYELLKVCNMAVVTSGTATLETALLNCPQVVVYRGNPVSVFIVKQMVKIKWISLVNLVAEKTVVRELIQEDYDPQNVLEEMNRILQDHAYCATMLSEYQQLRDRLGTEPASKRAAKIILEWSEALKNGTT